MRDGWSRFWFVFSWVLPIACAAEPITFFRNTAPNVDYTGSKACAGCHKAVYESFVRTSMGRSITQVDASGFTLPARIEMPQLSRRFEVFQKDGKILQSEIESRSGETIFNNTQQLEWAIGSGENGVSFAVTRLGYLFEAPLSYYTAARRWDLSPGYETADEGFSRPVGNACIVCHAGRAQPVPGREGMYRVPAFAEPAIGCENCHGPGQLHVEERKRGARSTIPDTSIVNPAHLPSRLAEDICMLCHQGGQTRALLPGREYSSFRPSTPLIRTVAIAELAERAKSTDLLEHHESMRISRCFEASRGRLGCLTCHAPHEQPDAAAAPAYFRAKCFTCHSDSSCRLSLTERRLSSPPDNCIGCHMPRREVGVVAHSALTDHRIPARPGQASSSGLRYTSGLPLTGNIPGVRVIDARAGEPDLPLITRLEILGTLLDRDPKLATAYNAALDEAARLMPDDPLVLAVLGRKALTANSPDAAGLLSRAETAENRLKGAARASTYIDLGEAYQRAGLAADSAAALERGQAAYPWSKEIRKRLVLAYIQQKDYAKSAAALRSYVADFPEDGFMRGLLTQIDAKQ
jgi:hypothetical protein